MCDTKSLKYELMRTAAHSDSYNEPGPFDQLVPVEAAMIGDVVVAFEDPVGEPVVAHVLPNVLDRIKLWGFGRQRDERHVFRHIQLRGDVPAGLIHEQDGVRSGSDGERDLSEMQLHGFGVAKEQDKADRRSARGADSAEDIGRGGSLILQGKRSHVAFGPTPGDLVLLADAGLVLEPRFEPLAGGRGDSRLVMLVMTGPRRELSIAQSAQFAAQDLFGHRQAVFVEHPWSQIDQSPAHHLMNRRDRSSFDLPSSPPLWLGQ
jgi:hypothetical protein